MQVSELNYNRKFKKELNQLIDSGIVRAEYYKFEHYKYIRCIDSRTKFIDNMPHIKPVLISNGSIYVICPYCNSIHIHGADSLGHRLSHCFKDCLSNTFKDYPIRKNRGYVIE